MEQRIAAVFYDGVTSKPWEAFVGVREPNTLEVEVPGFSAGVHGDRFQWPIEHKGMQWERTPNALRLSFGEHPRRVVIVRDPLFIKSFAVRMRYTGRQGGYDRLLSLARSGPALFVIGVLLFLVACYFWVLPWGAERLSLLLPRSVDERIGQVAYNGMSSELQVDEERSKALQAFGDRLQLSPHYALRYHVVREEQVNAFALPGGDIVVFTGILDRMDEPGELAALLAHEATHVEERHSTRMLVRNLAGYLFLSLLIGDVNGVMAVLAQNAENIRTLGYGRGLESDADRIGQERMKANGVDPIGMAHLLELLEREAHDVPGSLAFLSSHPLTAERITKAREHAAELGGAGEEPEELMALFRDLKDSEK